ncbi:hypothetical protein OPV22_028211 [Ensete ventricosum]|uniref:Uncharacterized protein n=1 Tax=Ensete ventricosum TaxID=4639 RepID=A0AAV8Q2H1_ENSVE|nr:hypothetical protein OPV22_028211 [Ensete ventricosum]
MASPFSSRGKIISDVDMHAHRHTAIRQHGAVERHRRPAAPAPGGVSGDQGGGAGGLQQLHDLQWGTHAVGRELPVPDHEKAWKNIVKMEPGTGLHDDGGGGVAFKLVAANQSYACLRRHCGAPISLCLSFGLPLLRFLLTVYCLLQIMAHEDEAMMRPLKLLS